MVGGGGALLNMWGGQWKIKEEKKRRNRGTLQGTIPTHPTLTQNTLQAMSTIYPEASLEQSHSKEDEYAKDI